jgi:hypothetical protein
VVSITTNDASDLPATTSLDVTGPNGTQSLSIETGCTRPLSLGDRFGSFVVFGMDRTGEGAIALGGEVQYQYKVTNPNASTADNVQVTDSELGEIVSGQSIPAGQTATFLSEATLFSTTTNIATVMGDVGGNACEVVTDEVLVDVQLPPQGAFGCSDPISELTMIWDGPPILGAVDVTAWQGDVGSTIVGTFNNVAPGDTITVSGIGPQDSVWEIFDSAGVVKLGESRFHPSCSDPDMNGIEDCGKNEGDSKQNVVGLLNFWLLEGMVDSDETLDCSPAAPPPPPACGFGPELMFLMSGLMWLHRRRLRKAA